VTDKSRVIIHRCPLDQPKYGVSHLIVIVVDSDIQGGLLHGIHQERNNQVLLFNNGLTDVINGLETKLVASEIVKKGVSIS
jgi:hypothetical protein